MPASLTCKICTYTAFEKAYVKKPL
jgi:hypothetical protein